METRSRPAPPLSPARLRAACNRAHARARAAERYGLDLGGGRLADWEAAIATSSPDAVALMAKGRDRVLYAIRHDGGWVPVIYDPATRAIVTFLPPRELEAHRKTLDRLDAPAIPGPEPEPPRPSTRRPRPKGPARGVAEVPRQEYRGELPATVEGCEARLAELVADRLRVMAILGSARGPDTHAANLRLAELAAERRAVRKALAHLRNLGRVEATARGLDESDPAADAADPGPLIRGAVALIDSLLGQLGRTVRLPHEQAIRARLWRYLESVGQAGE